MTEEKADITPNTGVIDESTVDGGPDKGHTEGVVVKTHGGKYAEQPAGEKVVNTKDEEDCPTTQKTHKS